MRYFVHAIDEASIHKRKRNGSYGLIKGQSENGKECQISSVDCFYAVEAKSRIDAVVAVSEIARIKGSDGRFIKLADACLNTKNKIETADVTDDESVILTDKNLEYATNSESELLIATCQIARSEHKTKWIELHKVYFYVLKENKIIHVK